MGQFLQILRKYEVSHFMYAKGLFFIYERDAFITFTDSPLISSLDNSDVFELVWEGEGMRWPRGGPIQLYKIIEEAG